MATIVKFYKDGRKDSRHLASSGSVIVAAALGEESMMANLPIAANTLRFLFGDPDYDPTVAGVGSSGTWTKKNTKFTNVWDWTNTNESWATAFGGGSITNPGAFADYENNPVKVIAAGDTSTVTDFSRFFQNCYAITEVCPIDTSNATNVMMMFSGCPNVKSGQKALYDTLSAIVTITDHTNCFKDCGSDTDEGRAELAQIPTSWGGTMEEEP